MSRNDRTARFFMIAIQDLLTLRSTIDILLAHTKEAARDFEITTNNEGQERHED